MRLDLKLNLLCHLKLDEIKNVFRFLACLLKKFAHLCQNLVVLAEADHKKDGCDIVEAMDPLLPLRPLEPHQIGMVTVLSFPSKQTGRGGGNSWVFLLF